MSSSGKNYFLNMIIDSSALGEYVVVVVDWGLMSLSGENNSLNMIIDLSVLGKHVVVAVWSLS